MSKQDKVGAEEVLANIAPLRNDVEMKGDVEYIKKPVRIDKFNTKIKLIELTPAVCTYPGCGFDAANDNNLGHYNELPEDVKQMARNTLSKHVDKYHTKGDA